MTCYSNVKKVYVFCITYAFSHENLQAVLDN